MTYQIRDIRTFIGCKDYNTSQQFYRDLDFKEIKIFDDMSLYMVNDHLSFYLQDYYVKKWVDNSMVFLEVDSIDTCHQQLNKKNLPAKYKNVKLSDIKNFPHGRECFLHDPSGILWHFCEFS